MLTPQLSVIIPTYNRKELLLKALEGYNQQTARAGILELLVVDDGSTDGTGPAVKDFRQRSSITIRHLPQKNRGPAAARNCGIREAKGDLILFGDDDIVPAPNLVAEHVAWNREYPAENFAMLGHVAWAPEVHPTPFMEWMGLSGVLFGFGSLSPGKEVSFDYFYSCNLSIKRNFLMKNGMFDESFPSAAYEDVELGYRLINKGLRLLYNPCAIGYHYKYVTYAEACRRQEALFRTRVLFEATEAGRSMKERTSRARPDTPARRTKLALAKALTPLLVPLTPLLDTHVRLPSIVYSLLYFFHVAPKARERFERSRLRHENVKAV